jgi:hypothetical protein
MEIRTFYTECEKLAASHTHLSIPFIHYAYVVLRSNRLKLDGDQQKSMRATSIKYLDHKPRKKKQSLNHSPKKKKVDLQNNHKTSIYKRSIIATK